MTLMPEKYEFTLNPVYRRTGLRQTKSEAFSVNFENSWKKAVQRIPGFVITESISIQERGTAWTIEDWVDRV
jgi:hypothetical protein